MILPIALYGHPILRKKAKEVTKSTQGLSQLIKNMWSTMYRSDGIGLAAPQVGESLRMFIIDADVYKDEYPELKGFKKVFINPVIQSFSGPEKRLGEGCLSLPGIYQKVKRPSCIQITFVDENFAEYSQRYDGFIARIIQHEYDHVEGKLFIDYLSPIKKYLLRKKLKAVSKHVFRLSYPILK